MLPLKIDELQATECLLFLKKNIQTPNHVVSENIFGNRDLEGIWLSLREVNPLCYGLFVVLKDK